MKMLIAPLGALFLIGPAAAQPPVPMQHPQMNDYPLRADARGPVRTAEEMRAGSAWGTYGGMSGTPTYNGMGGPDEGEEEGRIYPPCRSRSDDRCQQRR